MTWAFAREAGARRDVALGAGLLVAVPAAVVFMAQPDNFSLYQPIVLGALWLGARGLKGSAGAFVAAGALVGLAMLARNDGILVGRRPRPALPVGPLPRLARRSAGGDCRGGRRSRRSACSSS